MIFTQTQLDSLGGRPRIALGCAALLLAATLAHSAHAAVFSAREGDAPLEFTLPAYETTMVAIPSDPIASAVYDRQLLDVQTDGGKRHALRAPESPGLGP